MYDLIVVGDDLSSYIAAAFASHYGLSTVHIAQNDSEVENTIDGYAFNIDPTPLTGFGVNQTGFSLLVELNIPLTEQDAFLLNPAYQIIMPEHRIDFFNDKDSLVGEIIREFPEMSKEIKAFYDVVVRNSAAFTKWLHDHPFIQPRSIKDFFNYLKFSPRLMRFKFDAEKIERTILQNHYLKKILEAQYVLLSCAKDGYDSFTSHFQYSAPLRGVYHFPQAKKTLFNLLRKKLQSANGLYLGNNNLLSIKKGKPIEVEVENNEGIISNISAKYMIISAKSEDMRLLLKGKKRNNIANVTRPVKISHYPFTIHLGIVQKCIPEKMAKYVAVISDVNKDIYDDNLILLESNISPGGKKGSAEKELLTATVFLPSNSTAWSKDSLEGQAQSMIERLEYFLPFLKENIRFIDVEKSIDISIKYRNIVNPKYIPEKSSLTGFSAKNNKTRFRNIYLTGASLLMDAGSEGEISSGMLAVYRVLNKRK
jgi:phytoene dehydrogenase-like protein